MAVVQPWGTNQTVYANNSAYNNNSGVFIPEIWTGKLNVKYYASTCLSEIANTDYEGDIKQMGDKVIVNDLPDVTISNYTKGQEIFYQDLQDGKTTLEIGYAKMFAFKIDKIDKIQANRKKLDDWATDAAEKMKISIDQSVLQSIYSSAAAANAGATAGADSGNINLGSAVTPLALDSTNIVDWVVDMGLVLDEQSVPETDRWLVVPPSLAAKIKKSDLKDASITGDNESILRNGRIGRVDRFTIYTSRNLYKNASKWYPIAGHKSALTFAAQIVDVEHLEKLERTFGSAVRGLNVYGFKVMNGAGIVSSIVSV